ncbi:hypothetical protein V2W45_1467847 [Cenococcum geophilum]
MLIMAYLYLINILLLTVPVSFIVNYLYINDIAIFIVNFITIIPLTVIISYAIKEITLRAGNILGSLLNITFKNAVKLIISILALTKGQITIIKTSLISSILLNLLLIFIVNITASLLALYVSSLIILTAFYSILLTISLNSSILNWELSRRIAVILLIIYSYTKMCNALSQRASKHKSSQGAIITLKFSTVLVAFYSKFIVNSISNITASGTISTTFVSLILLLIVRNATKYVIAVIVACKDKISLVINVAIRFILPFIIILINYLIQDSKSNWLKGVLIMTIYTIIAVAGWFYPK